MKKTIMAVAGAAALTFGTAAHAAPMIMYTNGTNGAFGATFSDTPGKSSFTDSFASFTVGSTMNVLTGSISNSGPLKITYAELVGPSSAVVAMFDLTSAGPFQFGSLGPLTLDSGTYYLKVKGTESRATAGYSGTLTFTAAPEPAAWMLMIVGFGVVGFAMRRQRATYSVSYN